ncbi:MAG: hypothetical protein JNK43_00575 [Ignavibacteria bacterium]|nr:hypothetical protein [Ignavibacteria bacterium]
MSFYLTALVITIAVEFVVYVVFFRKDLLKLLLYCIAINLFTHPIAYYFYNQLSGPYHNSAFNIYFLIVELVVFLAETVLIMLLMKLNWKTSLLLSLIANLTTAMLSFVI